MVRFGGWFRYESGGVISIRCVIFPIFGFRSGGGAVRIRVQKGFSLGGGFVSGTVHRRRFIDRFI